MKDTGVTEITQDHIDKIDTFKIFKQGVPFKIGDMKITFLLLISVTQPPI